jgi:paraquat-inducible protein B
MTPRPSALRIGLFALLGLALLVAAVVVVFGVQAFKPSDRGVMHFSGSVYGLQVGSPVVFRGVRVGRVQSIDVAHDSPGGSLRLPVEVTLGGPELDRLLGTTAQSTAQPGAPALPQLLQRGLSAQLVTSSLLTGQRYIELDLAAAPAVRAQVSPRSDSLPEIPTVPAPLSLQEQLARLDLDGLLQEARAAAAALRSLAGGPQTEQTLQQLGQASQRLGDLAQSMQLAGSAR